LPWAGVGITSVVKSIVLTSLRLFRKPWNHTRPKCTQPTYLLVAQTANPWHKTHQIQYCILQPDDILELSIGSYENDDKAKKKVHCITNMLVIGFLHQFLFIIVTFHQHQI